MSSGKKIVALAAALCCSAVATADEPFANVVGERRLEQHTPAGSVPPLPRLERSAPSGGDEQPSIAEPVGVPAAQASVIVAAFADAYRGAGQPRLAVYFNRELSEEVREWIPGTQRQLDVRSSASYQGHGALSGPVGAEAATESHAVATSRHYIAPTGRRVDPAEVWMWQFEDAVTAQLLEGGAHLVDRAVIFRQMAKLSPQTAGMDGTASTTLNEISALNRFADILIEIRLAQPQAELGHSYRATAREITTGRILGSTFIDGNARAYRPSARYVATNLGYERVELESGPAQEAVARELALRLMSSLTGQFKK